MKNTVKMRFSSEAEPVASSSTRVDQAVTHPHICMHVLGAAATDVRVMREATALAEAGYAVSVVDLAEEQGQHEEEVRGVALKHVLVSRAFFATRFDQWVWLRLVQLFWGSVWRLLRTPADMYHAHDVSALPACYLVSRLRRKPLVFDAHEMPLHERPLASMGRSRRLLHTVLTVLLAYMLPRCAALITVSPLLIAEIEKRYRVKRLCLVRNILEYQSVPKSDCLRQRLGLTPQTRLALYTGNLQASRGLDRLVRAAPFLAPETRIVLLGKNSGTTQEELERLIADLHVSERVSILPPVPYADLLAWTSSADLGLYVASPDYSLNAKVSLPNKLFEYLMAGLPVLCSPIEPMMEIIRAYDVGQVLVSLEPAALGQAINEMLATRDALERQSGNALLAARQELHWGQERLQLLRLYMELLPTGQAGA